MRGRQVPNPPPLSPSKPIPFPVISISRDDPTIYPVSQARKLGIIPGSALSPFPTPVSLQPIHHRGLLSLPPECLSPDRGCFLISIIVTAMRGPSYSHLDQCSGLLICSHSSQRDFLKTQVGPCFHLAQSFGDIT